MAGERGLPAPLENLHQSAPSSDIDRSVPSNAHAAVFGRVLEEWDVVEKPILGNVNSASMVARESQSRLQESVKHEKFKVIEHTASSASASSSNDQLTSPQYENELFSFLLAGSDVYSLTDEERKRIFPLHQQMMEDSDTDRLQQNVLVGKLTTTPSTSSRVSELVASEDKGNWPESGADQNSTRYRHDERRVQTSLSSLIESMSLGGDTTNKTGVVENLVSSQQLPLPPTLDQQQIDEEMGDFDGEEIDALLREAVEKGTVTRDISGSSSSSIGKQAAAEKRNNSDNTVWASVSALSSVEFEALRPSMALQYPFELDEFQKQAIMRLERRECVFVAAHTSAGKTVVAEYAIAMARRHGSRAVYTSPIKALSNQKYRDFRKQFGDDVGLITGDISVNPEASCLIMTTEILRSMLYRGSDIIRDIEWVIFDEVHYVNDIERGVVWEEVIIMLPQRINMIFLSATTPNTIEFCDWIGRTKRRPVYVTSTSKRPVPLQHFLLHDDQFYKMMHAESGFQPTALQGAVKFQKEKLKPKPVNAANAAMKAQRQGEKNSIASQNAGKKVAPAAGNKPSAAGGGKTSNPGSIGSKDQWLSLIRVLRGGGRAASGGLKAVDFDIGLTRHEVEKSRRAARAQLEKYERLPLEFREQVSKREYEQMHVRSTDDEADNLDDLALLPVVIFCFSKKKCEEIADFFMNQDINQAREKKVVGAILAQMRSRLNATDAQLPQVQRVEEMAYRGIGVHTGGLLPILKEVVEVLFGRGLIKVLIATETFAMGVNMPAKSVVFNGIRKHDGKNFRDLLPGEYTQMAGRAGRRGLDKVGTVIVAVWGDLPNEPQMKTLLTGTAAKLSSRFRLTYGMIVNLLRGSDLTVEDMMKRSFSEFHTQRAISGLNVEEQLRIGREKMVECGEERLKLLEQVPTGMDEDIEVAYNAFLDAQNALSTLTSQMYRLQQNRVVEALCLGRVVWVLPALRNAIVPCPVPAVLMTSPHQLKVAGSTEPLSAWFLLLCPNADFADDRISRLEYLPLASMGIVTSHTVKAIHVKAPLRPSKDTPKEFQNTKCVDEVAQSLSQVVSQLKYCVEKGDSAGDSDGGAVGFLRVINIATSFGLSTFESMDVSFSYMEACKRMDYTLACVYFNADLQKHFTINAAISDTARNLEALEHYSSNKSLALFPHFGNRLQVLKVLGYVNPLSDTVLLKGRVACEINTCHELLVTEMIFNNILEPLTPPEAAALLSALVFQEKNDDGQELTIKLEAARCASEEIVADINELQDREGVEVEEDTKPTLNFGLAAAVYLWATGASFNEITGMTLVQEGSIVRCITRLNELLGDCRNAARILGNASLFRKMEAASLCIRRDIIFAQSMYL
jgi:antiviral helicase SKI2